MTSSLTIDDAGAAGRGATGRAQWLALPGCLLLRDGLRSILQLLSAAPGTVVVVDVPSPSNNGRGKATVRAMPPRGKGVGKAARVKPLAQKTMAKAPRTAKAAKAKVVAKSAAKKRSRATA